MSPTTFTADGRVIQHEGEAPPAEALRSSAPATTKGTPPAPKAPRAPRARTAPKKTAAVKKAETQARTRRVGKHKT